MNRTRKHKNPRAVMFLMWLILQREDKRRLKNGNEEAE